MSATFGAAATASDPTTTAQPAFKSGHNAFEHMSQLKGYVDHCTSQDKGESPTWVDQGTFPNVLASISKYASTDPAVRSVESDRATRTHLKLLEGFARDSGHLHAADLIWRLYDQPDIASAQSVARELDQEEQDRQESKNGSTYSAVDRLALSRVSRIWDTVTQNARGHQI